MRLDKFFKRVKIKNTQLILLLLILVFVSTPYITKTYISILKNYHEYQNQKEQARLAKLIAEENSKVDAENSRRELLLKKYGITKLERVNSCQDKKRRCITQYQIPRVIINYLFGAYLDRKVGSEVMCGLCEGKYKAVDPKSKYFSCFNFDKFRPSSDVVLSKKQTQAINELKDLGFYSNNDKELAIDAMDKCDRLNFKESFEEFQKESPSIGNLIRENPKDPTLNTLSKSYINFTILNR